jgi:ADP-ribose pyrophosphatase
VQVNEPRVVLESDRFRVEQIEESLRDGSSRPRHVIRHPGAVAILPVLADGRICLIRNRRVAIGRDLLELPAGTREPGEDPRETAIRELREETGFTAEQMEPLHQFFLAPGIMDERMAVFVATGLVAGEAVLEPNEFIENVVLSLNEAVQMCRDGAIEDAKTLVGLLIYQGRLTGGSNR